MSDTISPQALSSPDKAMRAFREESHNTLARSQEEPRTDSHALQIAYSAKTVKTRMRVRTARAHASLSAHAHRLPLLGYRDPEGGRSTVACPAPVLVGAVLRPRSSSISFPGRRSPGAGDSVSLRALITGFTLRSMANAAERRSWAALRLCAAGEEHARRWGTGGRLTRNEAGPAGGRATGYLGFLLCLLDGSGFLSGTLRDPLPDAERALLPSLLPRRFHDSIDGRTRIFEPQLGIGSESCYSGRHFLTNLREG